jgi:hypothetical protein
MIRRFYVMLGSLLLASCAHAVVGDTEATFDFSERTPSEFIEFLRDQAQQNPRDFRFRVDVDLVDWITEADIAGLIEAFDSTDECLGVRNATSSFLPSRTTSGNVAVLLVSSFRTRVFPSEPFTRDYTQGEKQSLRRWWRWYSGATKIERTR